MKEISGENMEEHIRDIHDNIQENIQQNIHEFRNKKTSMQYARVMAGGMCSLIGTLLAIYIGGWLMILVPLKEAFGAFLLGTLTKKMIFFTTVKCMLSLTTGGAIWCGGYILNRKIGGYEEY